MYGGCIVRAGKLTRSSKIIHAHVCFTALSRAAVGRAGWRQAVQRDEAPVVARVEVAVDHPAAHLAQAWSVPSAPPAPPAQSAR